MATFIAPEELMRLYAAGWFPMAMPDGSLRCFSPDPRAIIPLDAFHIPHGARKTLEDPLWEVRIDTAFSQVVAECARRPETWINESIALSYETLHRQGCAHSVEVWREDCLAGGLYGVELGGAFFGESMFHTVPGASKVALVELVRRLTAGGFSLLDTQWLTPHLRSFGAMEISRLEYLRRLNRAQTEAAQF